MKEEWLFPNAFVPVDVETTSALVVEIKRLIDVVGGMALAQPAQAPDNGDELTIAYMSGVHRGKELAAQPARKDFLDEVDTVGKFVGDVKANFVDEVNRAQPAQEPVAWHDKIMGMEVSMDVSTGEDDIDHRVYGQVYEVILSDGGGTPDVILAIKSEQNYTTPPAQPSQEPDYAYPTIEGYEEITGFKVNDTFRMGWAMARTTNDLFRQMEKQT
jgi:hypothetical protein